MLNWIAIYGGQYLIAVGGPLRRQAVGQPVANRCRPTPSPGHLGRPQLHARGIFIALGCAVLYCLLLNRTTLGFEVRAVGYNPEAARYGGISVRRSIILAMAISGAFAGLAGAGEVLGVNHSIAAPTSRSRRSASRASPSRCSAATAPSASSSRPCCSRSRLGRAQPLGRLPAELASSLAGIIQGVIMLLVGGEAVLRWLLSRAKRERAEMPPDDGRAVAPGGRGVAARSRAPQDAPHGSGRAASAAFVVLVVVWRTQSTSVAAIVSPGSSWARSSTPRRSPSPRSAASSRSARASSTSASRA